MTFAEAMQALQDGKKVRRKVWYDEDIMDIISIDQFLLKPESIHATDWEIVSEPKPKRTVKMRPQHEFEAQAILRDFKAGAQWERERTKVLVDALNEITNTTRLNDPDNHLADHLKYVAARALEAYRGEK